MTRLLRVLVVGALGGVGQGIVHALLERRAELAGLAISSRDAGRLAQFHAAIGNDPLVTTFTGSVANEDGSKILRDAVRAWGRVDVAIASLGGWWDGSPFTEIDDRTWHATIDSLLTTHAVCARTFVPELEHPGGKYLLVGGGAALRPVAGSSLVSIAAAAQLMLTRTLVAERGAARPPLIAEVVVDSPIATAAAHHGPETSDEVAVRDVGAAIAAWALAPLHPAFDWPASRRESDGPITILRR